MMPTHRFLTDTVPGVPGGSLTREALDEFAFRNHSLVSERSLLQHSNFPFETLRLASIYSSKRTVVINFEGKDELYYDAGLAMAILGLRLQANAVEQATRLSIQDVFLMPGWDEPDLESGKNSHLR